MQYLVYKEPRNNLKGKYTLPPYQVNSHKTDYRRNSTIQ